MGISLNTTFRPAPSVLKQHIEFMFDGRLVTLESDFRTPLYETIAEVVDYDCYQLVAWRGESPADVVVVDIGANVGVFSVIAGLFAKQVIAFEPIEQTCDALRENVSRNKLSNVTVVQAAVTTSDKPVTLEMASDTSVSARVTPVQLNGESIGISAVGVSLRSVLARLPLESRISLMKIDCEGGEYGIVEQIDKSNTDRIQAMTFEVHDIDKQRNVWTLWAKLESLGYRVSYKPEMFGRKNLHHLLAMRRID